MGFLNERLVFIIIIVVMSISTLFCLIGLATPGWPSGSIFGGFYSSTAALSIISLLLLVACVALAIVLMLGILQYEHLPLIFIGLLVVTSLFLLGTFTSIAARSIFYSYNLMITSFTFTYLSSLLAVYWLFGLKSTGGSTATPARSSSRPTDS